MRKIKTYIYYQPDLSNSDLDDDQTYQTLLKNFVEHAYRQKSHGERVIIIASPGRESRKIKKLLKKFGIPDQKKKQFLPEIMELNELEGEFNEQLSNDYPNEVAKNYKVYTLTDALPVFQQNQQNDLSVWTELQKQGSIINRTANIANNLLSEDKINIRNEINESHEKFELLFKHDLQNDRDSKWQNLIDNSQNLLELENAMYRLRIQEAYERLSTLFPADPKFFSFNTVKIILATFMGGVAAGQNFVIGGDFARCFSLEVDGRISIDDQEIIRYAAAAAAFIVNLAILEDSAEGSLDAIRAYLKNIWDHMVAAGKSIYQGTGSKEKVKEYWNACKEIWEMLKEILYFLTKLGFSGIPGLASYAALHKAYAEVFENCNLAKFFIDVGVTAYTFFNFRGVNTAKIFFKKNAAYTLYLTGRNKNFSGFRKMFNIPDREHAIKIRDILLKSINQSLEEKLGSRAIKESSKGNTYNGETFTHYMVTLGILFIFVSFYSWTSSFDPSRESVKETLEKWKRDPNTLGSLLWEYGAGGFQVLWRFFILMNATNTGVKSFLQACYDPIIADLPQDTLRNFMQQWISNEFVLEMTSKTAKGLTLIWNLFNLVLVFGSASGAYGLMRDFANFLVTPDGKNNCPTPNLMKSLAAIGIGFSGAFMINWTDTRKAESRIWELFKSIALSSADLYKDRYGCNQEVFLRNVMKIITNVNDVDALNKYTQPKEVRVHNDEEYFSLEEDANNSNNYPLPPHEELEWTKEFKNLYDDLETLNYTTDVDYQRFLSEKGKEVAKSAKITVECFFEACKKCPKIDPKNKSEKTDIESQNKQQQSQPQEVRMKEAEEAEDSQEVLNDEDREWVGLEQYPATQKTNN